MASKKKVSEKITEDTRQDIISLATEACESAAHDGMDYGDPYEKFIEKLDELLFKLTQG